MAEKPILFNTEMVQAILDGRKTQTRRLLKPKFRLDEAGFHIITNTNTGEFVRVEYFDEHGRETRWMPQPFEAGDILWVRETFLRCFTNKFLYKADDSEGAIERAYIQQGWNWLPSIHMPKEAARIFLRVKGVRVERLQAITLDDVHAEGIDETFIRAVGAENIAGKIGFSAERFETLWDSTIKPADRDRYGWNANPWVWVIEFERVERPASW